MSSSSYFRNEAATTIAADDPDGVTDIAAVLAHSSIETSEAHYNKARQIDAARQYQVTIQERRPPPPEADIRAALFIGSTGGI